MKIYRGTRNLSPLKMQEYYPSWGQFGEGMYFGNEHSQPFAMATAFLKEGFCLIGTFWLPVEEYLVCRHQETSSQSSKLPGSQIEISTYEVVLKDPSVAFTLLSFDIGFKDRSLAEKLRQYLRTGTVEEDLGDTFWLKNLDPNLAPIVHQFLLNQELKFIY